MKFRCDTCGQRYFSNDEPERSQSYRLPCLVCGGTVLLRGGDYPSLPTIPGRDAPGPGSTPDAVGEEPLGLALAAFSRSPPGTAAPPQFTAPRVLARRLAAARRWPGLAAAVGLVLASAAVLALALVGQTDLRSRTSAAASPAAGSPETAAPAASPLVCETANAPVSSPSGSPEQKPPSPRPAPAPPQPPAEKLAVASRAAPEPPEAPEPAASPKPSAASRLPTAEEIGAAVASDRPAFDACVQGSLRDEPELALAGRQIDLLMTVNPSGIVTSSEIEDPALRDTSLGRCLGSAVRKLVLPQFEGEPFQVRVPLRIGGE